MLKATIVFFSFLVSSQLWSQQNWSWLTGSSLCQAITVSDLKIDMQGNTYLTAGYFNSVTIGSTTFTSQGGTDSFIIKLNQSGNLLWSIPLSGQGVDYFSSIDLDSQGNIYCTGIFASPTIVLGSQTLTSNANWSFFICKISPSGQVLWAVNSLSGSVTLPQIAAHSTGLFIGGTFGGTLALGSNTITSNGDDDYFVAKYDYSGNVIWLSGNGGSGQDRITDITVLSSGDPVLSGYFVSPTISYSTFTLTGSGSFANPPAFLARYSSSGIIQWGKSIQTLVAKGKVSADPFGDFYFGGTYLGTQASIGTFSFTSTGEGGFYSKFDNAGNVLWANAILSPSNTYVSDIKSDNNGNVIFCGDFVGITADIGPLSVNNDSTNKQVFIGSANSSGVSVGLQTMGGKYLDESYCIDIAPSGDLTIGGRTIGLRTNAGSLSIIQPTTGAFIFVGRTKSIFTGVLDETEYLENRVYPNPCSNVIYLDISETIDSIELFALDGKRQNVSLDQNSGKTSIYLNYLPTGLYILKVTSPLRVTIYKIVKQE